MEEGGPWFPWKGSCQHPKKGRMLTCAFTVVGQLQGPYRHPLLFVVLGTRSLPPRGEMTKVTAREGKRGRWSGLLITSHRSESLTVSSVRPGLCPGV